MGENDIEVLTALVDDCGKADDLRACANHDDELQFAILLPVYVAIIKFRLLFHNVILLLLYRNMCQDAED